MARHAVLDNVAHKDLKIKTGYSAEFGDSINQLLVFPTEFVHLQREYPIFFRKEPTANFSPSRCSAWTRTRICSSKGIAGEPGTSPRSSNAGPS